MLRIYPIKCILLAATTAFVICVCVHYFTWSVDVAEIILQNGEIYKGKLSNSGFSQYKMETDSGVFFIDKTMVESTSWVVPSK